jgi:glycosyltransferase involved in cell wall biosynthesis
MISVVVPVMNRSDRIIPCLSTWIDQNGIGEIVIVDWSSTIPIRNDPNLEKFLKHWKIRIIRVNEEPYFISMSHSLNVGIFHARGDHILKIDIDYQLKNKELLRSLERSQFNKHLFCGTIPNEENYDFHGFCFFEKRYFTEINGYNENCRGWGFDDEDFYRRMEKIGLERVVIMNMNDFIYHMPHDDDLRVANYPQKNKKETNLANEIITQTKNSHKLSEYTTIVNESNYIELVRKK